MSMRQLATIFILCFMIQLVEAQERIAVPSTKNTVYSKSEIKRQQEADDLFHRIEQGMINSSVENFSDAFGVSLSLSVGTVERGLFSANQAKAILSEYFSARRITNFSFSRIKYTSVNPYATGRIVFIQKGNQESAQVYVLLSLQNSHWKISQFNIY
jgi:hypothetical protein